jgi:glutathione S-transferase
MLQLIGSYTSPFVRKVRMALAEKKIDYQFVEENVWKNAVVIADKNPLNRVPTLIMEDGKAVYDSRTIVEYLDTISPLNRLLPERGKERLTVRCWESLADGICEATVAIFLEKKFHPHDCNEEYLERQLKKIQLGVMRISQDLGSQQWCHGISFTLADLCVACSLGYLNLRLPEFDWRHEYPNLIKFYERISSRSSFITTAADYRAVSEPVQVEVEKHTPITTLNNEISQKNSNVLNHVSESEARTSI